MIMFIGIECKISVVNSVVPDNRNLAVVMCAVFVG